MKNNKFILWLDEITAKDIPLVGGKNASLGEMHKNLIKKRIKVPDGFVITCNAYSHFLKESNLEEKIKDYLEDLDHEDVNDLIKRGEKIRKEILKSDFPKDLKNKILKEYKKLCKEYGDNIDVAVRSSATTEDLDGSSFAGQQESFLNIRGGEELIKACKKCFASLFNHRAISYRIDHGFDNDNIYMSVMVQKMVRSDKACSGVIFTIDTETGFKDIVLISATYGLGESIVKGLVNPDEYYVFKPTLKKGYKAIIQRKMGEKDIKTVYSKSGTKNIEVPEKLRKSFVLKEEEILELAKQACVIEDHYEKPVDIEWAKDGKTGEIFIVQARPETVHSLKDGKVLETYKIKEKVKVFLTGRAIGSKIGQGMVDVIPDPKEIPKFKKGRVLVTDMTDPDWEPIMKIASAIVTNRGGRTCHAAIVSRELGIPCVIGTGNATQVLKDGDRVTVSCSEGEIGKIYRGLLKYEILKEDVGKIPSTKTRVMMNVGMPEKAFIHSKIPCDGVGLAREEFIINSYVGIHPLVLIDFEKLEKNSKDNKELTDLIKAIEEKTIGYENKKQFFIDKLAEGIAKIGAAFYPEDVIVRFSDFKSNEYANLIGGHLYEPVEINPMLGWRGASRYYDEVFKDAFKLECLAFKKVREEIGLINVKPMVPFCRTVEEGEKVVEIMENFGLKRGKEGLEIYMMCEIPSNVILADKFADLFDGFSIGSNDLTQLTLGIDRDSELVSHIYDERDEAVKTLIKQVVDISKKKGVKIGICGQAPSDFPEFTEFLINCGIDSVSLNPDTVIKTRFLIAEKEKDISS
ncbi:MAG: phosphoenolpyruvate synthase [Candidatus Aenigmarchaeota archaeon]|nr:phosphoenolpyruvate synthase [Candidatus Aenigmarchaeota archaeon]